LEEKVAEPRPPVWYQAMVSPETEPVKSFRVAVQVTEDPMATDEAEQTAVRLDFARTVSWAAPELVVLLASPL